MLQVSCVGGFGSPSYMRTLNGTANVNAVQAAAENGSLFSWTFSSVIKNIIVLHWFQSTSFFLEEMHGRTKNQNCFCAFKPELRINMQKSSINSWASQKNSVNAGGSTSHLLVSRFSSFSSRLGCGHLYVLHDIPQNMNRAFLVSFLQNLIYLTVWLEWKDTNITCILGFIPLPQNAILNAECLRTTHWN